MTCGDEQWWTAPDFVGLALRHGKIEHLIVQFDFMVQLKRNPRAEFSIPGATKTGGLVIPGPGSGKIGRAIPAAPTTLTRNTGYADIAALATNEIWEIKPKHLESDAVREATHYVGFAQLSCGPTWSLGKEFQISDFSKETYRAEDVVYRVVAGRLRYELVAEQGSPGSVLYYWRRNGRPLDALDYWAVRTKAVWDYFGERIPELPQFAQPNIPPVKFKPPVLIPDACIPVFRQFVAAINKSIYTTCAQRILEGGAVAVLLEEFAFNAVQGAANVAKTLESLKVQSDPQVRLARELYIGLNAAAASFGVPYAGYAAWLLLKGSALLIAKGGALLIAALELAPASAPAAVPAATGIVAGLITMFTTAATSLAARWAITAGSTLVLVSIPRVSRADSTKPVAVDVFPLKFRLLTPREARTARVGQTINVQGSEHYIVGLAST